MSVAEEEDDLDVRCWSCGTDDDDHEYGCQYDEDEDDDGWWDE